VSYSALDFLNFCQLFNVLSAIKFDPDMKEMFCFLAQKAEIHAFPAAQIVE
jgi:hypothetical protein